MVSSVRNSKEFACLFSSMHIKGTIQNCTRLNSHFNLYILLCTMYYFCMSTCFNLLIPKTTFSYIFFFKKSLPNEFTMTNWRMHLDDLFCSNFHINSFLHQKSIRITTIRIVANFLIMSPYVRLFVSCLVGWLISWSVNRSVGLSVCRLVDRSVCLSSFTSHAPIRALVYVRQHNNLISHWNNNWKH